MRRRTLWLAGPVLLLALILAPLLVLGNAALALHEEFVRAGYAWHCVGKTCLFISSDEATLWWQP